MVGNSRPSADHPLARRHDRAALRGSPENGRRAILAEDPGGQCAAIRLNANARFRPMRTLAWSLNMQISARRVHLMADPKNAAICSAMPTEGPRTGPYFL